MQSQTELQNILRRIDHKGYPAYKDTKGSYDFRSYALSIDHVQGDPFASPSKVSVHIKGGRAGFPAELYQMKCRRIALEDYLLRRFGRELEKVSFQAKGSGKSGLLSVSRCGQEVLERTACQIDDKTGNIVLRLEVGFPANGRTINARELEKIFFDFLPQCVSHTLFYAALDAETVKAVTDLAEDQQYIRQQLKERDLVAFVANGAVLPRESGVSGRPMKEAVSFRSPQSMETTMQLPHRGELKGMGIKKGITLIVGGGYHGKSTLLKALELGVYNHIPGDGREYVITDDTAVKIRAEDGRSVKKVDISMFISNLPNGKDTKGFYTEDASGSTSQAANVVEAMEAGTDVFLIDEDTSATNFMIRDELMQRVVNRDDEPITPFIDRVEELYREYGVSTVLVAGSSGSYFHKADCIIQMNQYRPMEITAFAKEEAKAFPMPVTEPPKGAKPQFLRRVRAERAFREDSRMKLKTMGREAISINHDTIDMRCVEQLADTEQLAALAYLLKYAQLHLFDGKRTLTEAVDALEEVLGQKGLAAVCESAYLPCGLAMPRRQEIFACFNRYRRIGL
ncbi:MAG: ABC-ATPase domain-containing protein [Clostridiales bacterium]|nr:ABC-ATPase domain-containing protein [Clostridiales bacterium]